jgi:hypothetical protein
MATIPNLHGSRVHVTAVELYGRHYGDTFGLCVQCGERAPCQTRAHAALVIAAAGEDPRRYDERLSPPAPGPGQPGPDERPTAQVDIGQTVPDHAGYRVGGRGERDNPAGFLYSREP